MIGLIARILVVSEKYRGRIYGAFVLSFLKGLLMKAPIVLAYIIVTAFIEKTVTKKYCIYSGSACCQYCGAGSVSVSGGQTAKRSRLYDIR